MSDRLTLAVQELVAAIREDLAAPSPAEPDRLLSIPDAAQRLGIGRSLLYQEIAAGNLRTVKVGRRRLVPAAALRDRGVG